LTVSQVAAKPLRGIGGFFAMTLDAFVLMFRPPFAWRELVEQTWFVARVSLLPAVMLAIPFNALTQFMINILLQDIGGIDLAGATAATANVEQLGPAVTVLVVGGASATAMCADLGARTIREELDAMRVMGINPIQALVVPRVVAATFVAVLLSAVVMIVGLGGSYAFAVYVQHVTPGAWVSSLTLLVHLPQLMGGLIRAMLFGLVASLIACYLGVSVRGGPQSVGNAVNEVVVYSFLALFVIDILATALMVKVAPR